jgi:hypothetical protein
MRPPAPRNWYAEDLTADLTDEATPEASAVLLIQAVRFAEDVALTPYCGCADLMDAMTDSALETRFFGIVVAPGAVHGRMAIGRSFDAADPNTTVPFVHEAGTSDGGMTGNDIVELEWYVVPTGWRPTPVQLGGSQNIAVTSADQDDTPAAPTDRAFELQTLGAPYVEPAFVTRCGSVSFLVHERIDDLETL